MSEVAFSVETMDIEDKKGDLPILGLNMQVSVHAGRSLSSVQDGKTFL